MVLSTKYGRTQKRLFYLEKVGWANALLQEARAAPFNQAQSLSAGCFGNSFCFGASSLFASTDPIVTSERAAIRRVVVALRANGLLSCALLLVCEASLG